MSYASFPDFERFLEGFGTNYYGTYKETAGSVVIDTTSWQSDIDFSYNNINTVLDSLGILPQVPVGTQVRTGSYHPSLIEWNALDVISTKLRARHIEEFNGKFPDWMNDFGSRCVAILEAIMSKKVAFSTDTTETGIGYPTKVTTNGYATFFSNWDWGFYEAADYPKMFHFRITSTNSGNGLGQSLFRISEDDGVSWGSIDYTVGSSWICIKDGLEIRWGAGSLTGTQNQFEYGDEWKLQCTPTNVRTSTFPSRYRTFRRG